MINITIFRGELGQVDPLKIYLKIIQLMVICFWLKKSSDILYLKIPELNFGGPYENDSFTTWEPPPPLLATILPP